ncbi:MAG: SUMF1/EgtB/PvdO family nonheme iron enzyme, partial [Candidatus Poribacteria bacterium]|nr:SUMF1/EgtB/PvdO family nonheme iron enzyme [Candidatus Poribacteria bacterium]
GTSAQFWAPEAVAVADTGNNKIRQIDTSGNVTTIAGSTSGFADGQGTSAQFWAPEAVAVADTGNNKIRQIAPGAPLNTTDFNLSLSGTGGTASFASGPPLNISGSGNVYTLTLPTISGTPNGLEIVTINPAGATAIYNAAGEAASDSQSNNMVNLSGTPPNQILWNKDGAQMSYIPAGSFEMGDHFGEGNNSYELPVHNVTLDEFYMDKTEVTVGQFDQFVTESGYSWAGDWNQVATLSPTDDHPMIYVTWDDAVAYAQWAGKRLPTEAEWEYAARGGLAGKRYPWGNEIDDTKANYDNIFGDGTTVAGSYATNGYGLYDVAGNVWEWCSDWWNGNYYSNSPASNPLGPEIGEPPIPGGSPVRVFRGGYWHDGAWILRVSCRVIADVSAAQTGGRMKGFRCVSSLNISTDSFTTLLPVEGQAGSDWFTNLSLDATDYTWST